MVDVVGGGNQESSSLVEVVSQNEFRQSFPLLMSE